MPFLSSARGWPAMPAQPGTVEGETHRAGEDGQQPDLTPPATRAATRGPSPPKIRRPLDQIIRTAPTPLLTAGDKGPRRGPPPRSKTLRCEPEQRMPRRRSPRLRHGPCPAAASCGGEGERGGRGPTPASEELPPRRPLGAASVCSDAIHNQERWHCKINYYRIRLEIVD